MVSENSLKNLEKGWEKREATQFKSGAQAVENGRKGGRSTQRKRRERLALAEDAEFLMSLHPKLTPELKMAYKKMNIPYGEDMTNQRMILISIMSRAVKGDRKAAEFMFNAIGETQTARLNQIRIIEGEQRVGLDKVQGAGSDIFDLRRTLDTMTDDELAQYEALCAKFTPEEEQAGGDDE